jgi:predicted component of type VI protein secretion system
MAAAERSATQQRPIALLGPAAHEYLERLADTERSLSRQIREMFALVREYEPEAVAAALAKAHAARACGADYIANILRQRQQRRDVQPPLRLGDPALNELATDPLSLPQYDAFILQSRKESRDHTAPETQPAQLDLNGPSAGSDDR